MRNGEVKESVGFTHGYANCSPSGNFLEQLSAMVREEDKLNCEREGMLR